LLPADAIEPVFVGAIGEFADNPIFVIDSALRTPPFHQGFNISVSDDVVGRIDVYGSSFFNVPTL
jgi:hypothetical protein